MHIKSCFFNLIILSVMTLSLLTPQVSQSSSAEANFDLHLTKENETQILNVKPSLGHHFNLKAPSQAQKVYGKNSQPLNLKLESTSGTIALGPTEQNCEIALELYLCDDDNTYCVPQKKVLQCQNIEQQIVEIKSDKTPSESSTHRKAASDELFIYNEPELALDQAQKTQKPILIDFFGTWCPPCNILDETVFNTNDFKAIKKDFVYLKLDADHPVSWDLKAKFNVKGYPTVVLTNSNAEEISRIVGSRSLKSFTQEMKIALKYKKLNFAERKKQADSVVSASETWQFGEMYFRQEDYPTALKYFSLAAKKKNLNDHEKDLLQYLPLVIMGKSTDKKLQVQIVDLVKTSLLNYPTEETFYDKITLLKKISEDTNDEKLKAWTNEQSISIVELWLKNPKLAANTEMTTADLWSLKANAYDELKNEGAAKIAYKNTAQAYLDLIQKQKLNIESSRGYNIERIYAIYKSGDFEDADRLYTQMQKIYPYEFTFFYNHAQMLKEIKKSKEAFEKAELAYKYSYGDNKLRATYLIAELQSQQGEKKKALSLLDEVIKTTPLPADENIRTHRYVSRLKKLKETIKAE